MSDSRLNEAYVALRSLLKAKFLTPETKERAVRAVTELNKEALAETLLNQIDDDTDVA